MSKQSVKASSGDLFARKGSAKPAGHLIAYERIPPSDETPDVAPDPVAVPGAAATTDGAGQAPEGETTSDATDENSTIAGSLLSIEFRKQVTESEIQGSQAFSAASTREVLGSPASMQRKITSSFQGPDTEKRKPLRFSTPTDCVSSTAEPSRPAAVLPRNPSPEGPRFGTMLALAAGVCLIIGAWFVFQDRDGETTQALEIALPETESEAVPEVENSADGSVNQADTEVSASAAELDPSPNSTSDSAPDSAVEPNFDLIRVEPDGEAVIAGRAAPNAELILLDNGEPIGTVTANWAGEWAFIPEMPLKPGNHQFSLVVKEQQGTVTLPAPGDDNGAAQSPGPDDLATDPDAPEAAESPRAVTGSPDDAGPSKPGLTKPESPRSSDATALPDEKSSLPSTESDQQSSIPAQDPPVPPHKPTINELAALGGDGSAHYMIQLSSTHSRTGAQKEWVKLTRIFPNLLDGMELNVHKANVDALGTRYRVRTGLFADQGNAHALCQKFQSLDQECLVIKR